MRGYYILETTTKCYPKQPYRVVTQTIIDNKVWWNGLESAKQRVRDITRKKIKKHNYTLNHDSLWETNEHKRYCTIVRGKFEVIKRYEIRGMNVE